MSKKSFFILIAIFVMAKLAHSQTFETMAPIKQDAQIGIGSKNINSFKIPFWKTTHIVSPEPILYVDISSPDVEGDLPEKNIFRLKPNNVNGENGKQMDINGNFTVTIVTETFITAYRLSFEKQDDKKDSSDNTAFIILIDPTKAIQLNNHSDVPRGSFDRLALSAMSNKRSIYNVDNYQYGMHFWLNNVYVIGDLILFDLGAKNHTKLQYDLNGLNFKLEDRYKVNATVSQEIEIKPMYSFTDDANTVILKKWRNFYILKKFTFPAQKVLNIQMTENQISGRPVTLKINYGQILNSQTLIGDKD